VEAERAVGAQEGHLAVVVTQHLLRGMCVCACVRVVCVVSCVRGAKGAEPGDGQRVRLGSSAGVLCATLMPQQAAGVPHAGHAAWHTWKSTTSASRWRSNLRDRLARSYSFTMGGW
jgi:hypothetical protein